MNQDWVTWIWDHAPTILLQMNGFCPKQGKNFPAWSIERSVIQLLNLIELQSFNLPWLGSVIEHNQTRPKFLPIEHK